MFAAALLSYVTVALASSLVHESITTAPERFTVTSAAAAEQSITLKLNLASTDLKGLETALMKAADPTSKSYGQWLSKSEVESYMKPTTDAVNAVNAWLSSNGASVAPLTPAGDWVSFTVPVATANKMLDTTFSVFSAADGTQVTRALQYSLPEELLPHVTVVHPITTFPGVKTTKPIVSPPAPDASSCSSAMTPSCLQKLYNLPTTPATNKTNFIGVTGYEDQYANLADYTTFLKKYATYLPSTGKFQVSLVDGGKNTQSASGAGVEANLDTQYSSITGVPVTFYSFGSANKDGADDGYLDTVTNLLGQDAIPTVLTTSYGFDTEAGLSKALSIALCNQYMALSSRGTSILFATGDGGVAATPGESCTKKKFLVTFPTCPYVTLVGATQNSPESGADLSAGGFSNFFANTTATWQSSAVQGYLKLLGTEYTGAYNASGRAYPDVSAIGQDVQVVVGGSVQSVAGTSCSSPIFSSVVGLLNDDLLNRGKPPLGFLNPWLYANPGMFNDVTSGSNPGCGTSGFPAKAGWDPVTGLGSPNYTAMKAALVL